MKGLEVGRSAAGEGGEGCEGKGVGGLRRHGCGEVGVREVRCAPFFVGDGSDGKASGAAGCSQLGRAVRSLVDGRCGRRVKRERAREQLLELVHGLATHDFCTADLRDEAVGALQESLRGRFVLLVCVSGQHDPGLRNGLDLGYRGRGAFALRLHAE